MQRVGTATCEPGEVAVGGGVGRTDGLTISTITIRNSQPSPNTTGTTPTAWKAGYGSERAGETLVVCAKIVP